MQLIQAIIRPERFDFVKTALEEAGFTGLNVLHVSGRGVQRGVVQHFRGTEARVDMLPKTKLEIVVHDSDVDKCAQAIMAAARTGEIGDGRIFVIPVSQTYRVRTGETGDSAL